LETCPTGAISRDPDTNIVVIDGYKCITCAMCAIACPFDVIRYYEASTIELDKSVALKCDNCIERQREGSEPACVEVCKVDALAFGDVNELARTASARLAKSVSVATGAIRPEMPRLPQNYEAWRDWGEDVGRVNERYLKERSNG
jgi:carbon-monoxide dehydrogenase iron sulfur subunit